MEWEDHYYCSHNYDEGAIFYNFDPGDIVHIDGRTIVIDGRETFNYYYNTTDDVRGVFGYDAVIFQTCVEGTDGDVYCYAGHEVA